MSDWTIIALALGVLYAMQKFAERYQPRLPDLCDGIKALKEREAVEPLEVGAVYAQDSGPFPTKYQCRVTGYESGYVRYSYIGAPSSDNVLWEDTFRSCYPKKLTTDNS